MTAVPDEHIMLAALEGAHYRASCTCGWSGPERASLTDADADKMTHQYERGVVTPEEVTNAPVRDSSLNGHDPKRSTVVLQMKAYTESAIAMGFMAGAWMFASFAIWFGKNVYFALLVVQVIVTIKVILLHRAVRREN